MVRLSRNALRLGAVGLASYVTGLVLTMPAALILPGAQGTVWNGAMPLAAGHRAQWHWSPSRSLAGLGVGLDWTVDGGDTQVSGGAVIGPGGLRIEEASGMADSALPFAYLSDLPFDCRFMGRISISDARIGDGVVSVTGTMHNSAGRCGGRDGQQDVAIPASRIEAAPAGEGGTAIVLTAADGRGPPLLEGTLAPGGFDYRLSGEGKRLLPFAAPAPGGGETVEVGF